MSFENSTAKGDKEITAFSLKSAINFKNFEGRKEIKLVHSNDVFGSQNADSKSAQKQIVIIDPETLISSRGNGLDILNSCEAAITYGVDLK